MSQASLSLWLRSIRLLEWQKQRLTKRKLEGARAGARKVHEQRVERTTRICTLAVGEGLKHLRARDVRWLIGVVLYWAEGAKPKPWNQHVRFTFTNMDISSLRIMRDWLIRHCSVRPADITYELYIHPSADVSRAQRFWLTKLNLVRRQLRTYFKKNTRPRIRRNVGREYYGTMRMRVVRSHNLTHRVNGWIQAVTQYCGVV